MDLGPLLLLPCAWGEQGCLGKASAARVSEVQERKEWDGMPGPGGSARCPWAPRLRAGFLAWLLHPLALKPHNLHACRLLMPPRGCCICTPGVLARGGGHCWKHRCMHAWCPPMPAWHVCFSTRFMPSRSSSPACRSCAAQEPAHRAPRPQVPKPAGGRTLPGQGGRAGPVRFGTRASRRLCAPGSALCAMRWCPNRLPRSLTAAPQKSGSRSASN